MLVTFRNLTILKGMPLLIQMRWKMKPKTMMTTGTKAMDQPRGMPQSAGRVMEKLTRGRDTCSWATMYKLQARAP